MPISESYKCVKYDIMIYEKPKIVSTRRIYTIYICSQVTLTKCWAAESVWIENRECKQQYNKRNLTKTDAKMLQILKSASSELSSVSSLNTMPLIMLIILTRQIAILTTLRVFFHLSFRVGLRCALWLETLWVQAKKIAFNPKLRLAITRNPKTMRYSLLACLTLIFNL